jgi:transposase-like protein
MCPNCESEHVDYGFWHQIVIYTCLDCNYEWEEEKED